MTAPNGVAQLGNRRKNCTRLRLSLCALVLSLEQRGKREMPNDKLSGATLDPSQEGDTMTIDIVALDEAICACLAETGIPGASYVVVVGDVHSNAAAIATNVGPTSGAQAMLKKA